MAAILLTICVAAGIAAAAAATVKKFRQGGGCCGSHEAAVWKTGVRYHKRGQYPWETRLTIGGMTCDNCARKVENALNRVPGTWAKVSISDAAARVRTEERPDEQSLKRAVREAGYTVLTILPAVRRE